MRGLSDLGPWSSQPPALSSKPHLLTVNINIQKQSSPVPQFPYLCKSDRNMPTTWFAASMRTCRAVSLVLTYREGGTQGHFL